MDISFRFEQGAEEPVIGSPQGDGDFESDGLPDTGETSAGGQLATEPAAEEPTGLEKVIDEIASGTLLP